MPSRKKVLVIGQTPPPYGGQAMMTQRLIDAEFEDLELFHVRMNFSKDMKSIGKFALSKILHLFRIVKQTIQVAVRNRITTLYYMPVGNSMIPLIRDILILLMIRPFFKEVIFHFRAAGASLFVEKQGFVLKGLARYVYRSPDLAIHLSSNNPDDGGYFGAKETRVIANGLEDAAAPFMPITRDSEGPIKLLYVGLLKISKGVFTVLKAARLLKEQGIDFRLSFIGKFYTEETKETLLKYCRDEGLESFVEFVGKKIGDDKWAYFREADIFCFPSYYESESFGNVVVEAMMFSIPVIGSDWRGIPTIIRTDETGFVIPPKSPELLAKKIRFLIKYPELRKEMGEQGRIYFERDYQLPRFLNDMETALHLKKAEVQKPALVSA